MRVRRPRSWCRGLQSTAAHTLHSANPRADAPRRVGSTNEIEDRNHTPTWALPRSTWMPGLDATVRRRRHRHRRPRGRSPGRPRCALESLSTRDSMRPMDDASIGTDAHVGALESFSMPVGAEDDDVHRWSQLSPHRRRHRTRRLRAITCASCVGNAAIQSMPPGAETSHRRDAPVSADAPRINQRDRRPRPDAHVGATNRPLDTTTTPEPTPTWALARSLDAPCRDRSTDTTASTTPASAPTPTWALISRRRCASRAERR